MEFRDPKFESFLKKQLPPEEYEQVKCTEACVVVSSSEHYNHRFVFITDKTLCIATNPPKSVVLSIDFCQILDIESITDKAKFLQKSLQSQVQHISLKVAKNEVSKKKPKLLSKSSDPKKCSTSEELVDIYILNRQSHIFPRLCFLWKACILDNVTDSVSSNEVNEYSSSAITNAFQNLYAELCALLSTQDAAPESVYKLVHEVKVMIKASMVAKCMIWRSCELFNLFNKYINKCLTSKLKSHSAKADHIECANLILEVVYISMKKAEVLDACQKVIQQGGQSFLTNLVDNIFTLPNISERMKQNATIKELLDELTVACCNILYETLQILEQGCWDSFNQAVNKHTFIQVVLQNPKHLEFSGRLIEIFFKTFTSNKTFTLGEVSEVYRIGTVMLFIATSSHQARNQLSNSYLANFTYKVNPRIENKLSEKHPAFVITKKVVRSLQDCLKKPSKS